jgi:alkylation response protein AidB-like acyl-CoA dehydrogenase
MDFRFDDEQVALRDAVRSFCEDHRGVETPAPWSALAGMGVFSLLVPDEPGGVVEAAIVFEQFGAQLMTGPLLWSTIAAPFVPGARRVAGAVADRDRPIVVEHAAESDVLVIVHADRVERCEPVPAGRTGEPFDPLTPAVQYDEMPRGEIVGNADDATRLRLAGTVLSAATLVGVAHGALDVATNYAKERKQFGVPIGSFQAIKHILADMYVRTEHARAAAYAAAAIADDERAGDVAKAASIAKLLAGEAAIANGRAAVQVLGGMGFTWEMLPHYYLKRAWVLEQSFGTGDEHALALSDALGAEVAAWT